MKLLILSLALLASAAAADVKPETVATSDRRWTGIAVSPEGTVFVNYPRWSDDVPVSVAKLVDGKPVPFPDAEWNGWKDGDDPTHKFVCVQAMVFDREGALWVLDPANPEFGGVVDGGPKLMKFNARSGELLKTIPFGADVAKPGSYLNDVRIDLANGFAYLTDSADGALVSVRLGTGEARRFLDDHPSTSAEEITLTIGGAPFLRGGEPARVHADGIAFDAAGDRLFYQALTGRTMYEVPAAALRDWESPEESLAAKVRTVGGTGAADGLLHGPDGRIYITALEKDAILRATPDGEVETVVRDASISWPDSFAMGPGGWLYFTTARIHEGAAPKAPFGVHRIRIGGD